MDAERFDTFVRRLSSPSSRRRVISALVRRPLAALPLGLVALNGSERAAAKRRKRKKKKRCVPDCTGKDCGSDGCRGSCGPCTGGACTDGTCVCPAMTELCGDDCVSLCDEPTARDPETCGCCLRAFGECFGDSTACCSRSCNTAGGSGECEPRREGAACDFSAQCLDDLCIDGVCRCPSGKVPCRGLCANPCPETMARNPDNCGCCVKNGESCLSASCCSNSCSAGACVGRARDADCTFDAQCASGDCRDSGPQILTCT